MNLHTAHARFRVALQDADLGGAHIQAGQGIIALNQSANRDEDVFTGECACCLCVICVPQCGEG